ncbi:hypothetical protein CR513_62766, partial [Mucuna pruriens]
MYPSGFGFKRTHIHLANQTKELTNPDLDLKLDISNIYSAQAVDNHYNNQTLDQSKKNLIDSSFATPDAGVSFNTNQNYEGQTHISNICRQIEETKNEKRSLLLIEQHQLKLQIDAFGKEIMVKEGCPPFSC